jgi:uncharacterized protein (TIGR03118 family)
VRTDIARFVTLEYSMRSRTRTTTTRHNAFRARLTVEALETRWVPSATAFQVTNLVSDIPGTAQITDPNLVNPWGIALSPTSGPFWVADNGSDVATLYGGDTNGSPISAKSLVVNIPDGAPDGQVFNSTSDFVVSNGTASGPAFFIFASENGDITGWNPNVPPPSPSTNAQIGTTVAGAVFKGLAIGSNASGNFLYATDFHNGHVDVFDKNFQLAHLSGSFTDPNLPTGFSPFGIQNINGKIYVSYAVPDSAGHDDVGGPGHGVIDVFDTNGNFLQRLATGGQLDSPWGMAMAPSNFGTFSNDLLVGNFQDGRIQAFDPSSGQFKGTLTDASGAQIRINGLWGLTFGNGSGGGDKNALYFAAGTNDEADGTFGSIRTTTSNAPPPIYAVGTGSGQAPEVKVFNGDGTLKFDFMAYDSSFKGGVRVAVGDVNGDGIPDIITAAGTGGGPHVRVFSGKDLSNLGSFYAYASNFTGGVNVSAGDVNGDGFADIITSPSMGGKGVVNVFSGLDDSLIRSFTAGNASFKGGVTVAAGDTNGDGVADIITGAGASMLKGPSVIVYDGQTNAVIGNFMAYASNFHGGVFVAAGDINGDGVDEIITGAGQGGGPDVRSFNLNGTSAGPSFFAFPSNFNGGARVAARDLNGDGNAEIIVGEGPGGTPTVDTFNASTGTMLSTQNVFANSFKGGVYVG